MANAFYTSALKGFLDGDLPLLSGTVKALLIDTSAYTYSAAHDFLDDVPGGARVGTAQTLASKTTTGGVFDADDVSFTGLSSPPTCEAVILYLDTGVEATSRLIAYLDTATSGLPTASGVSTANVAWNNGSAKILALVP